MYKSIREVGPETKKSRIAAARWCGRPNCGCCGGTTVKGDLVGARLSDYDWEAKDAKFDKRQGRKKKTLRDHRGGRPEGVHNGKEGV